ncbi:zinc transporter foi isoform X2 [Eurosta solidaginis]|uniref:zinc transporter foi isoform X2 n=1 Tax=Eurosta solidaginis TaxID=178769 RepID=UPI0035307D7F
MARHIMAVCVVCLLCADRIPCQEHIVNDYLTNANSQQSQLEYQHLNAKVYERRDTSPSNAASFGSEATIHGTNFDSTETQILPASKAHKSPNRRKRHAGHAHSDDEEVTMSHTPEITADFLQRIFDEYGHEKDGVLTVDEFQRILKQLGLNQLVERKKSKQPEDHTQYMPHAEEEKEQEAPSNKTCVDDTALVRHVQSHVLFHPSHSEVVVCSGNSTNGTNEHCKQTHQQQSNNTDKGLEHSENYTLSKQDMLHLCPVLLYQMASPLVYERAGCINPSILSHVSDIEMRQLESNKEDIVYVWIYAFVSVFACSILGLVGVGIIPFMDSRYYKYIIQYFVSLAVGTMTGDALLHLLPHSLAGQSEQNMVLKGLACMSGIVFFYITEHGLTMISEWRKRIEKNDTKQQSRAKVVRDPDSSVNNSVAGDKVCKSKYSSYPYCYDEIAMDTKNDMHFPGSKLNNISDLSGDILAVSNNVERKRNGKTDTDGNEAVAQSLIPGWHRNHEDHQQQQHHHHIHLPDSNTISTDLDGNSMGGGGDGHRHALAYNSTLATNGNAKERSMTTESVPTVILREHESAHHGHSHKHGHVHSPPESLSAVVWMIIMGDGLHNFTDGMAIGAAFAENIAGGFSTSLAVFCHELPHELGDFAILIKAGMSIKSAVYYNLLTSVLSFIGMIFGIIFGQSPNVAQWMFAVAAGLFIYIALVDMMPELSSAHKTVVQFVLQIFGMCTGIFIMLLIALYEGDLLGIFSSSSSTTSTISHQHKH